MKDKLIAGVFIFILAFGLIGSIIMPDKPVTSQERRKLATFPQAEVKTVFDGTFFEDFEKYTLDHFIMRDNLRTLKAAVQFGPFLRLDNNSIYLIGDNVFKLEYPLNMESVARMVKKLNELGDEYKNGHFAIIPDKNYYVDKRKGYLSIDYDKLYDYLEANVKSADYIELRDCLTLDDYYRTDPHWRQERLSKVVARLGEKMGFTPLIGSHSVKAYEPFYGAYYGQSALPIAPDTILYLESDHTKVATVTDAGGAASSVYMPEYLTRMDSYDVFLSGASPLVTIENESVKEKRELIIFRDSYASSLAPLMLNAYSKITLVDIRYMSATLAKKLVPYTGQEVLFLYSVMVTNNSDMLRG